MAAKNKESIQDIKQRISELAKEKLEKKKEVFLQKEFLSNEDRLKAIETIRLDNLMEYFPKPLQETLVFGETKLFLKVDKNSIQQTYRRINSLIERGDVNLLYERIGKKKTDIECFKENDIAEVFALRDFISFLSNEKDKIEVQKELPYTKLKWKGTPSMFGFIFKELAHKGFIDIPLRNGEVNYSGYAKICWNLFDIGSTQANIIKEFNLSNQNISDVKKAKFSIPDIHDLR